MATNPLPQGIDDLLTLAEDAADGAAIHQTAIGLLQNTETAIRADSTALQTAQTAHLAAQAAKTTLYTAQRSADDNARAFIGVASNVLANYLGNGWTGAWSETGFPNQSTAIPRTIGERQALLSSLATYFTNHAAHANAPLGVTAAQATTLFTALSDARSAVNNGLTDAGQKRAARNAAQKKLTKRLAGLIAELDQLLEGSDPRWLAFGLNMPDAAVTPEAPSNVVLTLGGPGEVLVDWDDVANASHYRVFKQEVGIDADFVVAGSPSDSDFMISGVTGGNTLRVKVSAVSVSLEGPPSAVAEITVGGGGSLGPPLNLQLIEGAASYVSVTFDPVDGAVEYIVEQLEVGVDPDFTLATTTEQTSLSVGNYSSGATVQIRVRARDEFNNEGPNSAVEEITLS